MQPILCLGRDFSRSKCQPFDIGHAGLFRSDLIQNVTKLVEIDGLGQMKIETGVFTAPNVFVRAKTGEGDTRHAMVSFCLRYHVVTAAIRQTDIAQNDIERARSQHFKGTLPRIGDYDLVAEMREQPRQRPPRVAVVFYEQNS
jgi:hypothetical protein